MKKKLDPQIARMDRTANMLHRLLESDKTNAAQKGRIFAQLMAWQKMRAALLPATEGDKLKEMQHAVQSQGGKRGRSAGAGSRGGPYAPESDGDAIKALIAALPPLSDATSRNSKGIVRANGRAPGDGGGLPVDGGSHVPAVVDGAGDRGVV